MAPLGIFKGHLKKVNYEGIKPVNTHRKDFSK